MIGEIRCVLLLLKTYLPFNVLLLFQSPLKCERLWKYERAQRFNLLLPFIQSI